MNWFIIQGKDHLGPFTTDFLKKMFSDGQLREQSLLWREGLDEPDTYYNLIVLGPSDKEFRPLVNLIDANDTEETPPDLPPEIKSENVTQAQVEIHKPKLKEIENEPKKESKSLLPYFVGTIAFLITLGIPIVLYLNATQLFPRPSKMGLRDYDRLAKVATSKSSTDKFEFSMAKDKSKLWIATNNLNFGMLAINLRSVPGKLLGEGKIEATSTSYLEQRIAEFNRFNFLEGSRLVDGYYQVEVYTLGPLETSFLLQFENTGEKEIKYMSEILISSMPEQKFNKALQKMHEKQRENEFNYWSELKQKYETLRAITAQIRDSLSGIFSNTKNWKKGVQSFENDYKMKFGQFFTNFVISNDKSYADLADQTFTDKNDVIASYTRLSRLAKSVGSNSMEVLHDLESFDGLKDSKKVEQLRSKSLASLDSIINECNEKLKIIEGK